MLCRMLRETVVAEIVEKPSLSCCVDIVKCFFLNYLTIEAFEIAGLLALCLSQTCLKWYVVLTHTNYI